MGADGLLGEVRANEAFVGQSLTIRVAIEGVELQGVLDSGSEVTLMRQSLFEHFAQANPGWGVMIVHTTKPLLVGMNVVEDC